MLDVNNMYKIVTVDDVPILEVSISTKPISLFFNMLHEISLFFVPFLY